MDVSLRDATGRMPEKLSGRALSRTSLASITYPSLWWLVPLHQLLWAQAPSKPLIQHYSGGASLRVSSRAPI